MAAHNSWSYKDFFPLLPILPLRVLLLFLFIEYTLPFYI